jgi:hypothetical protein
MENVPKIVRERLKANRVSSDHPDANSLTAFAERSLREDERAVVLDHLASCGDCRDIVGFALPAMEPVEATSGPEASRTRLTWPVLRWGFAVAGIVAIAALGIVQYQRSGRLQSAARFEISAKEARNQAPAPPAAATADKKADSSPAPFPSASGRSTETTNTREARERNENTRGQNTLDQKNGTAPGAVPRAVVPQGNLRRPAAVIGGQSPHGPRMPDHWQQQKMVQNQAASAAASSPFTKQQAAGDLAANMEPPAASETVTVEKQSAQLGTQAQDLDALKIESRQTKDESAATPSQDYALTRVGKAKPAETSSTSLGGTLASVAAPAASRSAGSALTLSAPVPRWAINSTGELQRSFDQGTTWQAVNVNANPAYFTDATSVQSAGETSRPKVGKVRPPIFRAFATTGVDVWAGGTQGALYHSLDAGDHWARVMPASPAATLTGDIVSVEFSDLQHGKVGTSTAEIWTTSDAGQTWQRQ